MARRKQELLISQDEYLAAGLHIGMTQWTDKMRRFIYDVRSDGLAVLNLSMLDQRIRLAAKWIARVEKVVVVGRKPVFKQAIERFADITGVDALTGRFLPGMLTNPGLPGYREIDLILVADPLVDTQAMEEAVKARVPIIAICDTFNDTSNVDLIIPANNRGRKAVATLFWLLAREVLKERDRIKGYEEYKWKVEHFLAPE
jgi:small subunit ribosomal protein S2